MAEHDKPSNRNRNLLMIAGVVVSVVVCVVMACLGVGTEDTSKAEAVVHDFNPTLPSAKVDEVTDDKFEAIKREQHRLDKEQNDELDGSSFSLLNGSTEQSQGARVNTEMAELSEKLKQQEEEQQRQLQAEREALETQRKKMDKAKMAMGTTSAGTGAGGKRSFNVEEQRQKYQDAAYKKLQDQYGKEIYPDRNVKPTAKKEEPENKENKPETAQPQVKKNTGKFFRMGTSDPDKGHDVRAVVHGTHKNLTANSQVKLRLLDPMEVNGVVIPKNSFVYGKVSFSGGRVQINIDNVNYQDNVLPFRGEIFDQDGSKGIYVPDNAISDATQQASGNTVSGAQTRVSTQRTGSLVQSGINGVNSGINAVKNAVQKKATENKVSISANYKVTIREKKN